MTGVTRRVLTIQSHVVSGYVGNKSATFPLQTLGFEVDMINSVQLSNHTGYPYTRGQVLNADDLEDLFEGLVLNNLHNYTHILTGYVGSKSFLQKVTEVVTQLKQKNPEVLFVCDPVMGDNGQMYVPEELLPVYRDQLTPLADIITPNQFEAELLTGVTITTEEDAFKAMQILHKKGIPTVVLTSSSLGTQNQLIALGSSVLSGHNSAIRVEIPRLPVNFTGTGDLFAALLLAWMAKSKNDLQVACEKTVNTLQAVLRRTLNYAEEQASKNGIQDPANLELRLIQSKGDIENPPVMFQAQLL